ncbi:MAG TPA: methyltransferase domain-containing protein [Acidimicrobiales bacterium]|nr:methyltransferase domain-containing protein [Acidimicrobiales bacterium]
MPGDDFETYFDQRARRFAAFYSSEPVGRLLGRGALYDRLRIAVELAVDLGARSVLDVGCGSGPLFAPLAHHGIRVTGIDPADAMVAMARRQAAELSGLVEVRQCGWEDLDGKDQYDLAVALGVFDYVAEPAELLRRMGAAAPHALGSFPSPGLRIGLRKVRYGRRGVTVHGYPRGAFEGLAEQAGMAVAEVTPLGRAGFAVHFRRAG